MRSRFELIALIGEGSFGVVWKARSSASGAVIALKGIKRSETDLSASIPREVQALEFIGKRSEKIVQLYEVIQFPDGSFNLAIEYCEYDLLALSTGVRLSVNQVRCYAHQLLTGVDAVHGAGYVHRDLKPANILVKRNNEIRLGDFGLATPISPSDMDGQQTPGTLCYMAPELLRSTKECDQKSDMWSIGCILYEIVTGRVLFQAKTRDQLADRIAFYTNGGTGRRPMSQTRHGPGSAVHGSLQGHLDRTVPEEFAGIKPLIRNLLNVMPSQRISAGEALNYEWLIDNGPVTPESLPVLHMQELHQGSARRRKRGRESVDMSPVNRIVPGSDSWLPTAQCCDGSPRLNV
jgi:serine/threonine protein kinase